MVLFVMPLLDQRNVHVLFLQRVNATLVPFKSILDCTCNEASLTFSHTTVYTHTHTLGLGSLNQQWNIWTGK